MVKNAATVKIVAQRMSVLFSNFIWTEDPPGRGLGAPVIHQYVEANASNSTQVVADLTLEIKILIEL